jgi:hypothetical protein
VVSDINPTQFGRTTVVQGAFLGRHTALRTLPSHSLRIFASAVICKHAARPPMLVLQAVDTV